MSHEILNAARKFDPIEHSFGLVGQLTGAVIGAIVGAAVVAVVAIATGGVGALFAIGVIIGCLGIGAGVGKLIGKLLPKAKSGHIADGSPTIFYGPEMRNAARVSDPLECQDPLVSLAEKFASMPLAPVISPGGYLAVKLGLHKMIGAHPGKRIESGVQEIFFDVEMLWASRIKDRTECDGRICEGIETILLGGTTGHTRPDSEVTEDSAIVEWTLWGLDWVGTILGVVGAARKGFAIAGAIVGAAGQFVSFLGFKKAGLGLGMASEVLGIIGGASKTAKLETGVSILLGGGKQGMSTATTETGEPRPLTPAEKQMRQRARMRVEGDGYAY